MIGSLLVAGMLASASSAHCPDADPSRVFDFDQAGAASDFRVRAGGLPLRGTFQRLRGSLRIAGAHACLRTVLDAKSVVMGTETFGAWARSSEFFDAARHPQLEFRSQTFDVGALLRGGVIDGTLTLRGTTRRQRLRADPARCSAAPRAICKLRLRGAMLRSAFGMRGRRPFVSDRVDLELRVEAPRAELSRPASNATPRR
ncbi:MAG: YceI family protein [Lysobacterales bacterium]